MNITAGNTGSPFAPAGTRGTLDNGKTVFTTKIRDVIDNIKQKKSVYDYAIVLVGNVQESNGNNAVTVSGDNNTRGFTIMSADFDFDEEPDYCLEWQLGTGTARNTIAPIRFDFLPVVELGIAGKLHNSQNFFSKSRSLSLNLAPATMVLSSLMVVSLISTPVDAMVKQISISITS